MLKNHKNINLIFVQLEMLVYKASTSGSIYVACTNFDKTLENITI